LPEKDGKTVCGKAEFFTVPATARSARQPEGPAQLGALFLLLLLGKQKKEILTLAKIAHSYMFIFFACPKKMNQKKRQPITWSA